MRRPLAGAAAFAEHRLVNRELEEAIRVIGLEASAGDGRCPEAEVSQIRVSRASQASAPSPGKWAANRSATIESTLHPVPNVARISA